MKKIVIIAIFMMLFSVFINLQLVEKVDAGSEKTIYVDDDGDKDYSSIQSAIDYSSAGDTIYVYSGTYYENIVIDKQITLIGEDKNSTIVDGSEYNSIINITADWVNMSGFTIKNGGLNSYYEGVYTNRYVILVLSNNVSIIDNILDENFGTGIHFGSSNNNIVCDNVIINNSHGINLGSSNSNNISSNIISNNTYLGIDLYNSKNNKIIENTISDNGVGIEIWGYSNYNEIKNNNINKNGIGILSYYSNSYNFIIDNIISLNYQNGIKLEKFDGSSNNYTISGNVISDNGNWGICLESSNNNSINDNFFENNSLWGVYNNGITLLNSSNYNTIFGNTFIKDWIELDGSHNNIFYNNNFISQHIQSYCCNCKNNVWYNPKLGIGNYWDDYDGIDENDDSIGDVPHIISSGNIQDNFPLMNPYGETFDIPSSPQEFKATAQTNGINLTWNSPQDDGGINIEVYEIYKGLNSGNLTLITRVENTFYIDTDVIYGETYYYQISAVNDVGVGEKSKEATAKSVGKGTTGFEIILLIVAIGFMLVLKRKSKRLK